MRPHGKIKLDTVRKPSFVVMARGYDWINIRQSLKQGCSVPRGDVTRGRQWGFGSVRGEFYQQGTYWSRKQFHKAWKRVFIHVDRPGSSDIRSRCLLKTGLIIQPARAISVYNEQVTCIAANWDVPLYVIHSFQKKTLIFQLKPNHDCVSSCSDL